MKHINVYERTVSIGNYVVENKSTVRGAAKKFSVSKSTVHKDITERFKTENPILHKEVEKALTLNKNERHLKGGESTRRKYLNSLSSGKIL